MSTDQNTKSLPSTSEEKVSPFSERELALIQETRESGFKPISPTLSSQMFQLFLEGYSCAEIAKLNPSFSEGEVLICRQKFEWDKEKDIYAFELQNRVKEKLMKVKLESLEFLSNTLSASHKYHNQKLLKYLQTGHEDDKPDNLISGTTSYKAIIETIAKLTGEDRVTTQNINSNVTVTKTPEPKDVSPEDRKTRLKKMLDKKK